MNYIIYSESVDASDDYFSFVININKVGSSIFLKYSNKLVVGSSNDSNEAPVDSFLNAQCYRTIIG